MTQPRAIPTQLFIALAVSLAFGFSVAPALGQAVATPANSSMNSTIQMSLDTPADGFDVQMGRKIAVGGWAVDTAPGGSIDIVRIYLDGPMDSGTLLGNAKYGGARPDVGTLLGNPAYANSGFDYAWIPTPIGLGTHIVFVYAHSAATDTWAYRTVSVNGPNFPTYTPTRLPMPTQAPAPPPQGQGGYQNQGGFNPYQGPMTPYGGTYLNTANNNYPFITNNPTGANGGWNQNCLPSGGIGPSGPIPPMPCGNNFTNQFQLGAPFTGF